MQKIFILFLLISTLMLTSVTTLADTKVSTSPFGLDDLGKGSLSVTYISDTSKRIKLMIQKDDQKYYYNLKADGSTETFSLQMGTGKYIFSILENTTGSSYKYKVRKIEYIEKIDEIEVHKSSIQNIKWNKDMDAVKKAYEITKDKTTTLDKVEAIHKYLTENFCYDPEKLKNLKSGYIPDIENTFKTKTGICYDFSSLFAAMLRSQDIAAKMVTGYTSYVSGYHAWNEVYIKETNEWIFVDITADAGSTKKDKTQMTKNKNNFTIKYAY